MVVGVASSCKPPPDYIRSALSSSLDVQGGRGRLARQNRRARESFQGGSLHAKTVHREVDEAEGQGGRPLLHPVVSMRRINELRVGHDGMLVGASFPLHPC